MPDVNPAPQRRRPRKKGDSVKLNTLFQGRASQFIKADAWMYGKKESVEYLCLDPLLMIEAYSLRFKIKQTFRSFKQQIGGFRYHFWTKSMSKINKYRKKTELPELAGVEDPHMQHLVLKTIEATERFVLCASIAMGITQMMAFTPSIAKTVRKHRYLRTSSEHMVSEATVLEFLRKNFFRLLCLNPTSEISRFILRLQVPDDSDMEVSMMPITI